MRLRSLSATLHAWLGALGSLFILSTSISGLAIAFSAPLLHLETGAFPSAGSRAEGESADLARLLPLAQEQAGERFLPLGYLGADAEIATSVDMIYGLSAPPEHGGEVQIVTFDPATDEVIASFYLYRTLTHELIDFHYELLAGDTGAFVVALAGVLMAALALLGLYLWWPTRGRIWRKATRTNLQGGTLQKSFRLHSLFGFWCAVAVVIWGLTGVYWSKPDWAPVQFQPATQTMGDVASTAMQDASCGDTIDIGTAVTTALNTYPGTTLLEAEFAAPWQSFHTLHLTHPDDFDRKDGDRRVWQSTSCRDQVLSAGVDGLGVVGAISASIHSGETFGVLRIPVIVVVGVTLSMLSFTGLIVWFGRYLR